MSEFRRALCPVCGVYHGQEVTKHPPGKPYIALAKGNYWDRTKDYDPGKPFGIIQESLGRGTFRTIGFFQPDEDPDGYFPLVKARLLAAMGEWVQKGWITQEEVEEAIAGKPIPEAAAPEVAPEVEETLDAKLKAFEEKLKTEEARIPTEAEYVNKGLADYKSLAKDLGFRLDIKAQEANLRAEYKSKYPTPEAVSPKVAPAVPTITPQSIAEKWQEKTKNIANLKKDLVKLDEEYDLGDVESAIDEYEGIEREEYESQEEYQEARDEAWASILKALGDVEELEEVNNAITI